LVLETDPPNIESCVLIGTDRKRIYVLGPGTLSMPILLASPGKSGNNGLGQA